jgi:hypothetical protein
VFLEQRFDNQHESMEEANWDLAKQMEHSLKVLKD